MAQDHIGKSEREGVRLWQLLYVQKYLLQGGGNSNIFFFYSDPWGNDSPFEERIFSKGLKPPTSYCLYAINMIIQLYRNTVVHVCNVFELNMISYGDTEEYPGQIFL